MEPWASGKGKKEDFIGQQLIGQNQNLGGRNSKYVKRDLVLVESQTVRAREEDEATMTTGS